MRLKVLPIISIIALFIIIFLIFYKGLQNSNVYTPNVNVKNNIPIFTAEVFDNEDKVNSERVFKDDKFYLLNIWASWCLPCRDEHNYLMRLSKIENIEIIGLNYKDNINNAQDFLNELNNPYDLIFLDSDGIIAIEWGAYGVPESFLIHKKKIVKKIIGPISENSLVEIKKIIK